MPINLAQPSSSAPLPLPFQRYNLPNRAEIRYGDPEHSLSASISTSSKDTCPSCRLPQSMYNSDVFDLRVMMIPPSAWMNDAVSLPCFNSSSLAPFSRAIFRQKSCASSTAASPTLSPYQRNASVLLEPLAFSRECTHRYIDSSKIMCSC